MCHLSTEVWQKTTSRVCLLWLVKRHKWTFNCSVFLLYKFDIFKLIFYINCNQYHRLQYTLIYNGTVTAQVDLGIVRYILVHIPVYILILSYAARQFTSPALKHTHHIWKSLSEFNYQLHLFISTQTYSKMSQYPRPFGNIAYYPILRIRLCCDLFKTLISYRTSHQSINCCQSWASV